MIIILVHIKSQSGGGKTRHRLSVIVGYSSSYVFKYVKTNKKAPVGAEGATAVSYSAVDLFKVK